MFGLVCCMSGTVCCLVCEGPAIVYLVDTPSSHIVTPYTQPSQDKIMACRRFFFRRTLVHNEQSNDVSSLSQLLCLVRQINVFKQPQNSIKGQKYTKLCVHALAMLKKCYKFRFVLL